ncbi:hypothetical protein [Maribacter sp. 2307ULW6-5]|uniref:hypothetical protein n=1 Tax=Maribacter sp. 2307ULW6-5 TaxID=3386275 RepID=UPI0039BD1522
MIALINLLFDTATLVLIWAVQLAIYPGLTYYAHPELVVWHRSYTQRITFVVLPLMFGQLAGSIWAVMVAPETVPIMKLALVLAIWVMTFAVFVPLHHKIEGSTEAQAKGITAQLVAKNWWRTLLWTLVFVLGLYGFWESGWFGG